MRGIVLYGLINDWFGRALCPNEGRWRWIACQYQKVASLKVKTGRCVMKPKKKGRNDESLSALLQDWKITSELPTRFQENVWRGIERAERQPLPTPPILSVLKGWLERLFPRPALALAYVATMLTIGGIVGLSHGQLESSRLSAELGLRYVQSVDPYQANP